MLIYHQAFDFYNCIFRLLQLLSRAKSEQVEVEKLRIWDFYLVFPNEVSKHVTFPNDLFELRKIFKEKPNPYEDITDGKRIFERMKEYQLSALRCLASYELIDQESLNNNWVKRTDRPLPKAISDRLEILNTREANVIKLVTSPLSDLPMYGSKGFKFRTGLLDFKYD